MGLDGVELVMSWEEEFGVHIPDEVAARMCTPRDATRWIANRIEARAMGPCRTRRTFHRVRRALCSELGIPRGAIRPGTRLDDLLPPEGLPRERWEALREQIGPGWGLKRMNWCGDVWAELGGLHPPRRYQARHAAQTVGDAVRDVAAHEPGVRPATGTGWSREAVSLRVRRRIIEELGVTGFSEDADFVRDLGV